MKYTGKEFQVTELVICFPALLHRVRKLVAGDVGFIAASIKNVRDQELEIL